LGILPVLRPAVNSGWRVDETGHGPGRAVDGSPILLVLVLVLVIVIDLRGALKAGIEHDYEDEDEDDSRPSRELSELAPDGGVDSPMARG